MRWICFAARLAAVLVLAAMAASADAQSPPQRVRGTIAQVSADTITVHTAAGADQALKVAPDARIVSDRLLALTDIKPGD